MKRYVAFYGDDRAFADDWIPSLREKLSSLSEFMREIKVGFARFYNRCHNRRGYFWGDRFKSVIVENGETLINCLAYIDLNPLRAGLVDRPEDYRWNSLGYHVQTNNQDNFLSTDFGLKEFNVEKRKDPKPNCGFRWGLFIKKVGEMKPYVTTPVQEIQKNHGRTELY